MLLLGHVVYFYDTAAAEFVHVIRNFYGQLVVHDRQNIVTEGLGFWPLGALRIEVGECCRDSLVLLGEELEDNEFGELFIKLEKGQVCEHYE